MRILWSIFVAHWALLVIGNVEAAIEDWQPEEIGNVCSTSDLDHSKLVECNPTECLVSNKPDISLWPRERGQIVHMYSSRSGDRFNLTLLPNLDFIENDYERNMNINTTLYVNTNTNYKEIVGFGTTLDPELIASNTDDATFRAILRGFFAQTDAGIGFSILRIPISRKTLLENRVTKILHLVDDVLAEVLEGDAKVKMILSFDWPGRTEVDIEALKTLSLDGLKSLECEAVTMPYSSSAHVIDEGIRNFIQDLCSETKNIFGHVSMVGVPDFVKVIPSEMKGLLIHSNFDSTYSIIDYVSATRGDLAMLTLGSPKELVGDYGNWQTAQNHATEILNHFKHESMGFIEHESVIDVFSDQRPRDGSIYSFSPKYSLHFRGPMFYAIGHFSQHVTPGSRRLETKLSTQPNMFAANYIAFLARQNHVVAVILNDNEHDLPFRLAIDGRIRAHVMLMSKSFNTIVIKL